ncbi:MAG TPA: type II toxin-antitoxin system VapC family toxin [Thermoleophilaceae bacterium]|nr:type II toxin-antitoxin system VapC family toxin [Thermoleophilaceae bacterium]
MKRLLLDTNVAVWLLLGDRDAVSSEAQHALSDERNSISLSAVSVWEIAIKRSLGKFQIDSGWGQALTRLDFDPMPVTSQHAEHVEHLPWHHRDPFDRLLVAQAALEDHVLLSADAQMTDYDVEVVW